MTDPYCPPHLVPSEPAVSSCAVLRRSASQRPVPANQRQRASDVHHRYWGRSRLQGRWLARSGVGSLGRLWSWHRLSRCTVDCFDLSMARFEFADGRFHVFTAGVHCACTSISSISHFPTASRNSFIRSWLPILHSSYVPR